MVAGVLSNKEKYYKTLHKINWETYNNTSTITSKIYPFLRDKNHVYVRIIIALLKQFSDNTIIKFKIRRTMHCSSD